MPELDETVGVRCFIAPNLLDAATLLALADVWPKIVVTVEKDARRAELRRVLINLLNHRRKHPLPVFAGVMWNHGASRIVIRVRDEKIGKAWTADADALIEERVRCP